VRAELKAARDLGEQLLQLAESAHDPDFLLEAHYTLGETLFCLGDFASACSHHEQGTALYDLERHRSHAFAYGLDPGVFCLSRTGYLNWMFGYPDRAVEWSEKALALARELGHSNTVAAALVWSSWLHQLRRDRQRAKELAQAAINLATDQGFAFWLATAESSHGWSLAEQGLEEQGVSQIRQGLAAYR
jgi:tetratricopeptide (TPR) repeat protein